METLFDVSGPEQLEDAGVEAVEHRQVSLPRKQAAWMSLGMAVSVASFGCANRRERLL